MLPFLALGFVASAHAGCGDRILFENQPGSVVALGPVQRSGETVRVLVTVFDFEGDEVAVLLEAATAGGTFRPITTLGDADPSAIPTSRRQDTSLWIEWDATGDGFAPGTLIELRATGERPEEAPLRWGPSALP